MAEIIEGIDSSDPDYIGKLEEKLKNIESKGTGNPYTYFICCFETGRQPALKLLYEHGAAEVEFRELKESELEKTAGLQLAKQFVYDASKIPLSNNPRKNAVSKRAVLIKYFPYRFGPKGKQNINDYSAVKLDVLFNKVTGYYQRKLNGLQSSQPSH